MGVVGSDPEIAMLENGMVANFSVCVNKYWRNAEGEKHKTQTWFKCTAFGKVAERVNKVIKKSSWAMVEGELRCNITDERREFWSLIVANFYMLERWTNNDNHA